MAALNTYDADYFQRTTKHIPGYWKRFDGGRPDLKDRVVMDLGCGQGALCIDLARSGAKKVIGVDVDERRSKFARDNLAQNFAELADVIEFHSVYLHDYDPAPQFDYVFSKDTFEHVMGLEGLLQDIKQRLKPGGRLYTGFGPIYKAPYGDHGLTKSMLLGPWGHLILGEKRLVARVNRTRKEQVQSIEDLGMNKLTFAEYARLFKESGMNIVQFKTNVVGSGGAKRAVLGAVLSGLSRIPLLKEYVIFNIYAILEKPR